MARRSGFLLICFCLLMAQSPAQEVQEFEPPFDPLPPAPKEVRPSGPLDGKALRCVYRLADIFYVLSPAYFLFEEGGFSIIDVDDAGAPKLVAGKLEIFSHSIYFYLPDNHKLGGERVLNRQNLTMQHRDRDSFRKVKGQCAFISRTAVEDAFGRRYFPR